MVYMYRQIYHKKSTIHIVDGRNPAPPGMYKNLANNGINYQPQLVSRILSINHSCIGQAHESYPGYGKEHPVVLQLGGSDPAAWTDVPWKRIGWVRCWGWTLKWWYIPNKPMGFSYSKWWCFGGITILGNSHVFYWNSPFCLRGHVGFPGCMPPPPEVWQLLPHEKGPF